ncbi:unnamed protein product [Periconia digitata]|uniref:RBR-type E3 ubiquitin transferase n=1 Tax=Periconia digitata TaxID=1303443 RepID=A0A9W4UDQ4_9PLEO|nr:unnamed protein product [Periconia digitata]
MAHQESEERAEEWAVLQAIYPELEIDPGNPFAAHMELMVKPSTPLPVTFEQVVERLAYLPPLHLHITLPVGYPEAPPSVTVSTVPSWLPPDVTAKLANQALLLWEEYGGGQLFTYISHLQEAAETTFGLSELTLPSDLKPDLLAYSIRTKRELFDKETFECEVCLEPKKGSVCYRMQRCNHVFCIACLQDYYNNCIKEGDVNNVKCMSVDCGQSAHGSSKKKDRLISPKELLQIPISIDNVDRYAKIKRKKKIEADPTIIYCPRSWCQGAMRTKKYPKITNVSEMDESDSEADEPVAEVAESQDVAAFEKRRVGITGMDRLAVCEDCNLAFCQICLASWHGDFVRCEPRDSAQLTEEDQASLNFIMKNCSPCPTCSVPCQKSHGCNHMTCFQCKSHFCYLCAAWLRPENPYEHFNNPKNKGCYQRLMDMAEGDMAQGDIQFGGRRGAEQIADFWEQEAMRIQMEINELDS